MRYVGVDLHKTSIVACYWLEDEKFKHKTFQIEEIEKFKQSLQQRISLHLKQWLIALHHGIYGYNLQ